MAEYVLDLENDYIKRSINDKFQDEMISFKDSILFLI